MDTSLEDVERQARALSAQDRARLAERMLESLETPLAEIETEWAREIEARVAAFDRGETRACAAEDVLAEAQRLNR